MFKSDSLNTLFVALILAVACSVLVSVVSVSLKPVQVKNQILDRKKNLLVAAGLYKEGTDIDEAFKNIKTVMVNLKTGEYKEADDSEYFKNFKQLSAGRKLTKDQDMADIKSTAKKVPAYLVMKNNKLYAVILPIYGSGLWSTMYGFLSLEPDMNTVIGLTFYDQQETPGLGGEVDNPKWKALWMGKKLFEDGKIMIELVKGGAKKDNKNFVHQVDGLSGATLTTRGVQNLVRFWISDLGFGSFLDKLKEGGIK